MKIPRAAPALRAAPVLLAAAVLLASVALAACGSGSQSNGGSSAPASADGLSGTVTVFAAASLKESFAALAGRFEQAHPGTKVVISFGPSSGLATQITQGAPADVFASANETTMGQVVAAGEAADPTVFARNAMQIAVPAGNPAHVRGVGDLGKPGLKVAVCQPKVPCGATAAKVFTQAGVRVTPVTREVDVKAVLAKVSLGEVDAGVVYVTDVRPAGSRVQGVEIPDDVNATTDYPVVALSKAPNPLVAKAFTEFVLSPAGASVLADAGFTAP